MKKELIIALATVLTSTMVTIPAHAGTPAEGNASGGFIGIPGDLGAQTTEATLQSGQEADPGDITENKALMDAFGGIDKYYASYERVTPEYFKQKYAEAAELLKDKIDNSSDEAVVSSAVTAVTNHFTSRWSEFGFKAYYSFNQRMRTDYLTTGRMFGGFEPAMLLHTIMKQHGISSDIWSGELDSYTAYVQVTVNGTTKYVAFGGTDTVIYNTVPVGLRTDRLADMYMGAYKDFID